MAMSPPLPVQKNAFVPQISERTASTTGSSAIIANSRWCIWEPEKEQDPPNMKRPTPFWPPCWSSATISPATCSALARSASSWASLIAGDTATKPSRRKRAAARSA